MKKKAYRFLLLTFAFAAFSTIVLWQGWQSYMATPLEGLTEEKTVIVAPGTGFSSFADDMEQEGVWRYPAVLVLYVRFFEPAFLLKAGEYNLQALSTPRDILDLLDSGKVVQYKITFIEGETLQNVLLRLEQNPVLVKTGIVPGKSLSEAVTTDLDHLEGWILPETYYFKKGDTDLDLLQRAYRQMQQVLREEWDNRIDGLPYDNPYQALIMASVVEKETGVAEERERIAGVFVRRLQQRMRLQTDPTVIYGMGEQYKGNISKADLRLDNPYNTYTRFGLPPTPIAMPGRASIYAALHPAAGNELYFVAKGDGSHHFSATLEEHQQAVKRYQILQRRANYQSSPPASGTDNGRG